MPRISIDPRKKKCHKPLTYYFELYHIKNPWHDFILSTTPWSEVMNKYLYVIIIIFIFIVWFFVDIIAMKYAKNLFISLVNELLIKDLDCWVKNSLDAA